jgi:hypothetical protein
VIRHCSRKETLCAAFITPPDSAGRIVVKYFTKVQGGYYMWDELAAAWINPTLVTKKAR